MLIFRYGTVGSGKTLKLLQAAESYNQKKEKIFLISPAIDTRFGRDLVRSRSGLQRKADLLVDASTVIDISALSDCKCVLVDECQFLSMSLIDQLRTIADTMAIPVICFGLRTDFKRQAFEGSRRLFEIADLLIEEECECSGEHCTAKAQFSQKRINGEVMAKGSSIELSDSGLYEPVCSGCYGQ